MNKRRGELTSAQIITLVIVLLSFIVAIIFLFTFLDLKRQSDSEVCRLSVLTRATATDKIKRFAPLNCNTGKYCLTLGKDSECLQFAGEDHDIIELSSNPETASREIEEISANAMFDCWSEMGQGKLDTFANLDQSLLEDVYTEIFSENQVKPKCRICSRIALANDLKENKKILEKVNINEYMEKTIVPRSDKTYLQTFTDDQIRSYPLEFTEDLGKTGPKQTTDHMAFLFMQIIVSEKPPSEDALKAGFNTGLATVGVLSLTPTGIVRKIAGLGPTAIGTLLAATIAGGIAYEQAVENQGIASKYCGQFTSAGTDPRYGCSLVAPVDYNDFNKINNLCKGGIEGNL